MKADALDRVLDAERSRKGFSTAQRDALWKGIDRAIALPTAAPNPDPPQAPSAAPPASAAPVAAAGVATAKVAALVALAALGGIGLGALGHAQWAEPRTVVVDRPVAAPPVAAPPVSPALSLEPPPLPVAVPVVTAKVAPERAAPSVTSAASASAPAPAKDPALARERNLLDMARTALSRGDASGALGTLDTHAREFPKSQLSEEREVLAIQALASANRLPEARTRARAFKATYPKSALGAVVDEAVQ